MCLYLKNNLLFKEMCFYLNNNFIFVIVNAIFTPGDGLLFAGRRENNR